MQQYDFLRTAQYDPVGKRFEVKMVASDQSPADFLAGEPVPDKTSALMYWRRVPWLFRSVELRANAVSSAPFRIMRGETEVDHSATWKNTTKLLPDPAALLWNTEAALTIWGYSYIWRERNRVAGLPLRYIVPSTIEPELDEVAGLLGFWRSLGKSRKWATTDDLLYFWKPDPSVEIGPPTTSAVTAALSAAGVLYSIDAFAAAFVNRGAIKATLLTVEGNPEEGEKQRLKSWWNRAVTGIGNAFSSNVFSAAVKPVVVGEGLESLANTELTAVRREDVATAMGIPQTLLFSTGAGGLGGGGVVTQDEKHFYDKTVRAECEFIAGVLNDQLFTPLGLRMEWLLETLDVFQTDEHERATSFKLYADAGLPKSLVAEMLGLELPDGWEYADLDPDEPEPQPVPPALAPFAGEQPAQPVMEDDEDDGPAMPAKAMLDDLRAWRRKSKKAGRLADFESCVIPDATMAAIRSADDWLAALDAAIAGEPARVPAVKALVDLKGKMWNDVQRLYEQRITAKQFVSSARDTVEEECEQAWNDGMVKNGLDPKKDTKPEHELALLAIVAALSIHLAKLAKDVEQARRDKKDIEMLRSRVDLWANRYPDVVNQAMIVTKPEGRFEWVFGNTEQHCTTCAALEGHVATGDEWQESGYKPQGSNLECGGWRCDCSLVPTDAPSMGVPTA